MKPMGMVNFPAPRVLGGTYQGCIIFSLPSIALHEIYWMFQNATNIDRPFACFAPRVSFRAVVIKQLQRVGRELLSS